MMLLLPGRSPSFHENFVLQGIAYGYLLSPARTMTGSHMDGMRYAVDNEVFTGRFQPARFVAALERIAAAHGTARCLFVVAPDVVGDAPTTLAQFREWGPRIRAMNFPVALAGQDGMTVDSVPWDDLDAIFIGGSTRWKLGTDAAAMVAEGKRRGKWTHVGRVNSVYRACRLIEPPDSVDGTAWAKHPSAYAAQWGQWVASGKPRMRVLL